jgi:hypothetical protein
MDEHERRLVGEWAEPGGRPPCLRRDRNAVSAGDAAWLRELREAFRELAAGNKEERRTGCCPARA